MSVLGRWLQYIQLLPAGQIGTDTLFQQWEANSAVQEKILVERPVKMVAIGTDQ